MVLPCHSWAPVEGTRDICSCCEMGNCESPALSRRLNPLDRWPSRRFRRHTTDGKVPAGDTLGGRGMRLPHRSFLPQGKRLKPTWSSAPCSSRGMRAPWESSRMEVKVSAPPAAALWHGRGDKC